MDSLKIYTQSDVLALVNKREGEIKLGEKVQIISDLSDLNSSSAKFVLLGIPEDIGVRANYGVGGTKTVFNAALKALLNIQSNSFLQGDEILVLGHFEIEEPTQTNVEALRNKVSEIDSSVAPIIQKIVAAGKVPIVIGGGHNNAYPIIKGVAEASNQSINVVNIDAHADLRNTKEGRHSGNGFSFALQEKYLNEYRVFGLHQNYTHQNLATYLQENPNLKAFFFEDILQSDKTVLENWLAFTQNIPSPCGLEIDLDSIENVLSSAISPSGFALNDIRKILLSGDKTYHYLHICEGATALANGQQDLKTGKTIAYLVSDFIKATS
jgi:formiminoglutamase